MMSFITNLRYGKTLLHEALAHEEYVLTMRAMGFSEEQARSEYHRRAAVTPMEPARVREDLIRDAGLGRLTPGARDAS